MLNDNQMRPKIIRKSMHNVDPTRPKISKLNNTKDYVD